MTAKFTPGQWIASGLVEGAICTEANRRENLLGLDAEGYAVFMNKHDAVIAAAAPDMYEALSEIALSSSCDPNRGRGGAGKWVTVNVSAKTYALLSNALAKANGGAA